MRGQGLFVGVEFQGSVDAHEVKHQCFEKRLLITSIGSSVIRMVPPLIVTKAQCDQAVKIIKEAVEACHVKKAETEAA